MGPVLTLTFIFIGLTLLTKKLSEYLAFISKSNLKYKFIDFLANYIYYGDEIGVDASLSLDSPTPEILKQRQEGHAYLKSKLTDGSNSTISGQKLATKLVDCRFALAKICMPLLRELEFQPTRNFIKEVDNNKANASSDGTSGGMLEVTTEPGDKFMYIGNDAVHTLGTSSFYAPVQEEISRRMSLYHKNKDAKLRFCPIAMNPELEKNANLILGLTGMDQVRYSLSGSEAMDACFKDVRASCRNKKVIVRFSSAYHGHVSGVDFLNCQEHIFLKENCQESIDFIEKYHYRIAAVVVNPMQHFTGINKPSPPGEKLNLGSRVRSAVSKDDYARWLHALAEKCNYCTKYLTKVAFVMDDIYFAFRTPELFSTNYFTHPDTGASLKPNVLVVGKGVAAGYPISMVLGQRGYLNTYDKKYLLQVNKTVGTLTAWHGGIVASNVYLESIMNGSLLKMNVKEQLSKMVRKFDTFTDKLNENFTKEDLPLRIRNFSNTFSINYLNNSMYNSRYPQYLMAEGVVLANYSTGKFNLSDDVSEKDLSELTTKFVDAGIKMQKGGYFEPVTKSAKKKLMLSLALKFSKNMMRKFYDQIMQDKHIDIEVSHNHPVNKFGHFWSSVFMILVAYPLIYKGESLQGCLWFFITHVVRQSGHFFYEHQDTDIEKLKFGHKDASKKEAVVALICAALMYHNRAAIWESIQDYVPHIDLSVDQYVSLVALFTIVPHYVEITYQYGYMRGMSWLLKILTDPFTDLLDFYTHATIHPKWFLDFKDHSAKYQLDIKTKKVTKVE